MTINEQRLFRYMDIGFYLIFIPIFLLLIPTDHIVEKDIYFFAILMAYMAIIHYINRRCNPLTSIFNKEYKMGLAAIGATLLLASLLSRIEALDLRGYNILSDSPARTAGMKIRSIWMLYFIELSFSIMTALVMELMKQTQRRTQIEEEKNAAELALYRSQINPHFMLNTLNTLYGLYVTKSTRTGELFLKFTDMIKYTFTSNDKEQVMLCEELKYLDEYITLHTLRLSEQTRVEYHCDVLDESLYVAPMIFITFIENAFKYGVSSSERSEIKISISQRGRELTFSTENRIFARAGSSTGIGIRNCKKRLELLYSGAYSLEYGKQEELNKYIVTLKIRL